MSWLGPSQAWKGRLATERGTIHLVNQNAEEGNCLLVKIGSDTILDVEDETRSHC